MRWLRGRWVTGIVIAGLFFVLGLLADALSESDARTAQIEQQQADALVGWAFEAIENCPLVTLDSPVWDDYKNAREARAVRNFGTAIVKADAVIVAVNELCPSAVLTGVIIDYGL